MFETFFSDEYNFEDDEVYKTWEKEGPLQIYTYYRKELMKKCIEMIEDEEALNIFNEELHPHVYALGNLYEGQSFKVLNALPELSQL